MWTALILFVARVVFFKDGFFSNFQVYATFGAIGDAISVSYILLKLYEKYFWKFNKLDKTPRLYGVYDVTLVSSFDEIARKGKLTINQTFTTISIKLVTDESVSVAVVGDIIENAGNFQLVYSYRNEPQVLILDKSSIHYGTAMLNIVSNNELNGQYFTHRKTVGTLIAKKQLGA